MTEAEHIAARFHEVYELLAPYHGYETRRESDVSWMELGEPNKGLMIHVAEFLLREKSIQIGPNMPSLCLWVSLQSIRREHERHS